MALADLVVVMDQGRIEQSGTPREVYNAPETLFVARFIGGHNVISGELAGTEAGYGVLQGRGEGRFLVPNGSAQRGEAMTFAVRNDKVALAANGAVSEGPGNSLPGTVRSVEYQGAWVQVAIETPQQPLQIGHAALYQKCTYYYREIRISAKIYIAY